MMEKTETKFEQDIRESGTCPGRDKIKSVMALLCWDCFKYRKDILPFKYFNGDLKEWLKLLGR